MNFLYIFFMIFSVLGAADYMLGNRFGLGKEFEKGFMMLGNMALSMIGMIVLAPAMGEALRPVFDISYELLGIDSSIMPAMLLANDMGGAFLSIAVAQNEQWGMFHGLVTSSMMGVTFSFTIPVMLGIVESRHHKDVLLGLLCGIVTIPIGCVLSGILYGFGFGELLWNYMPLILFAGIVAVGLMIVPDICVKILSIFGNFIKILVVVGLVLGLLKFLTGVEIIKGLGTFEEGAYICFNAAAVMSGAFPCMYVISKLLSKPLRFAAKKIAVDEKSVFGFISSLATSMTTFKEMNTMEPKGIVLNSAFAVSAAFTFCGHLAFTMTVNAEYAFYVIVGKLTAGVFAVLLAGIIYSRVGKIREV